MVLVTVMFVFRFFVQNTETQSPPPFRFQTKVRGAGCFYVSGGPGALAPRPSGQVGHQASWQLGGRAAPAAGLPVRPSSLLLPLLWSHACQGWREARPALSSCVCV